MERNIYYKKWSNQYHSELLQIIQILVAHDLARNEKQERWQDMTIKYVLWYVPGCLGFIGHETTIYLDYLRNQTNKRKQPPFKCKRELPVTIKRYNGHTEKHLDTWVRPFMIRTIAIFIWSSYTNSISTALTLSMPSNSGRSSNVCQWATPSHPPKLYCWACAKQGLIINATTAYITCHCIQTCTRAS